MNSASIDEFNLCTTVIAAIETRKGEIDTPASSCEAYAKLLLEVERCGAAAGSIAKLMKELWSGVKENDETVVCAYCKEIESVCRATAAAYANMAAVAGKAEEINACF